MLPLGTLAFPRLQAHTPGMADIETDDGLNGVPWWDATALRMVQAIERSIVRLRLDCQGEFIAIINAIEMQLESRETESAVVRLLADSMAALAAARPIGERERRTLEERLADFVQRVNTSSGSGTER